MKTIRAIAIVVICFGLSNLDQRAQAAFHLMQIEQVIGGVNGDPNAQAIQLRMRANSQEVVSASRIRAWDAAGANPVTVIDILTDVAEANALTGRRILITTPSFGNYTNVPLVSDFTITNKIPASYLAAGRLTFESNNGANIYWSLAWGGAGYTGSHLGTTDNDLDGNFGPAFAGALPSSSTSSLLTNLPASPAASSRSTNNAANYGITPGAATFTNYAGNSFIVTIPVLPDPDSGDFDGDDDVDGEDFLTWQRNAGAAGTFAQGDANHDGNINGDDLAIWEAQYNTPPPLAGLAAIPEPNAITLVLCGLLTGCRRKSRGQACETRT